VFLIYLYIIICLKIMISSPVCSQDRVNGVLQKKEIIKFARKDTMTMLPHPPGSWMKAVSFVVP
jgi:hypothetical protein